MRIRRWIPLGLLLAPVGLLAQDADLGAQLAQRGLPSDLIAAVQGIAADAVAQDLPVEPLADKAMEGWAKHVPQARITAAVRMMTTNMLRAREQIRAAGVEVPPGMAVAAAADAMDRGLTPEQAATIIAAATDADLAGHGLRVVSALIAQGIPGPQAVEVVVAAMRRGRGSPEILDLPSVAQAMRAQGMTSAQIGERMMRGNSLEGATSSRGVGQRPGSVPPGMGPPESPPGRHRRP
jgi:hypothetical protein